MSIGIQHTQWELETYANRVEGYLRSLPDTSPEAIESVFAKLYSDDCVCPSTEEPGIVLCFLTIKEVSFHLLRPETLTTQFNFTRFLAVCERLSAFGAAVLAQMASGHPELATGLFEQIRDSRVVDCLLGFVYQGKLYQGRFGASRNARGKREWTKTMLTWSLRRCHTSGQALLLSDTLWPLHPHSNHRETKLTMLCACGPRQNLPMFYKMLGDIRQLGWRLQDLTTRDEKETLFAKVLLDFMQDRCGKRQPKASPTMTTMVCRAVEMGLSTHQAQHVAEFKSWFPELPKFSHYNNKPLFLARQSGSVDVLKLLYRTGAVTNADMFNEWNIPVVMQVFPFNESMTDEEKRAMQGEVDGYIHKKASNPRSLQKACLLRVSHQIGTGPDRTQIVLDLDIGFHLKEKLMHQDTLAKFIGANIF